jgi:hypothetical protein
MTKELKEKLDNLPTSWNETTLEQYLKLIHALPAENDITTTSDIDVPLLIISILTDTDFSLLEELSLKDILPLVNKISFVYTSPEQATIGYKCKDISELTYDEFVTYMQMKDEPYANITKLLPIFFPELKDKDLDKFSITTINACFFLLSKNLQRHLQRSQIFLSWQIVKQVSKQKMQKLNPFGKAQ